MGGHARNAGSMGIEGPLGLLKAVNGSGIVAARYPETAEGKATMKGILVIADGLGGRPTDRGGKTCLEDAKTPILDKLAAGGALGLVDPIGPGVRPGSDTVKQLIKLGKRAQCTTTGDGPRPESGRVRVDVTSRDPGRRPPACKQNVVRMFVPVNETTIVGRGYQRRNGINDGDRARPPFIRRILGIAAQPCLQET